MFIDEDSDITKLLNELMSTTDSHSGMVSSVVFSDIKLATFLSTNSMLTHSESSSNTTFLYMYLCSIANKVPTVIPTCTVHVFCFYLSNTYNQYITTSCHYYVYFLFR